MAATLAHHDAFDAVTTTRACFSIPTEYLELVGIAPPATGNRVEITRTPTQGRTHVPQPCTQHTRYGPVQGCNFFFREGTTDAQGMNSGFPESFVHIDVAHSGNKFLIQQQGLDLASAGGQHLLETCHGKVICQGFWSYFVQNSLGVAGQEDTPELAHILETQLHVPAQFQDHMFVLVASFAPVLPVQVPGHTQMNQQGQVLGQGHDNIFAPACDPPDGAPFYFIAESGRRHTGNGPGPEHPCAANDLPDDFQLVQVVHHGLYFRQFRHDGQPSLAQPSQLRFHGSRKTLQAAATLRPPVDKNRGSPPDTSFSGPLNVSFYLIHYLGAFALDVERALVQLEPDLDFLDTDVVELIVAGKKSVMKVPEATLCMCRQSCSSSLSGILMTFQRIVLENEFDLIRVFLKQLLEYRRKPGTVGSLKIGKDHHRHGRI